MPGQPFRGKTSNDVLGLKNFSSRQRKYWEEERAGLEALGGLRKDKVAPVFCFCSETKQKTWGGGGGQLIPRGCQEAEINSESYYREGTEHADKGTEHADSPADKEAMALW